MDTSAFFGTIEIQFLIGIVLSIFLGYLIGYERELRHKDAGISTHTLVIAGSMVFTLLSAVVDPLSTSRISSGIVTGVGFLGAGLILKDGVTVRNLTTAASVWYAAAIGMALGYGFYGIAIIAAVVGALVPRIPHTGGKV
ncbi:MAG TPA: MgtC/SapB family protein [Candidatus Paceibacterota bacterium]|jgi:putative Mg2+ transporter-C (MgtC) family protein|nr:MgtC/SapB family protein [Candidatus Paceibacterota bacterium]